MCRLRRTVEDFRAANRSVGVSSAVSLTAIVRIELVVLDLLRALTHRIGAVQRRGPGPAIGRRRRHAQRPVGGVVDAQRVLHDSGPGRARAHAQRLHHRAVAGAHVVLPGRRNGRRRVAERTVDRRVPEVAAHVRTAVGERRHQDALPVGLAERGRHRSLVHIRHVAHVLGRHGERGVQRLLVLVGHVVRGAVGALVVLQLSAHVVLHLPGAVARVALVLLALGRLVLVAPNHVAHLVVRAHVARGGDGGVGGRSQGSGRRHRAGEVGLDLDVLRRLVGGRLDLGSGCATGHQCQNGEGSHERGPEASTSLSHLQILQGFFSLYSRIPALPIGPVHKINCNTFFESSVGSYPLLYKNNKKRHLPPTYPFNQTDR